MLPSELLAPNPAPLASAGAAGATDAPTLPTGPIRSQAPWGAPYGAWERITRWYPLVRAAADEFGVPWQRLLATLPTESGGNPRAMQRNPSNGNSYGLGQVVAFGVGWEGWHKRVKDLAGEPRASKQRVIDLLYDPALNLRVAASILRDFFRQHGSWDRASSAYFLGNPEWRGADTVNGNTGPAYRDSLNGLIQEIEAAAVIPEPVAPEPTAPEPPAVAFPPEPEEPVDPWRPYPYPPMVDLIVPKPYDGAGFDRVEFRRPLIRGFSTHITDGPQSQSIEFFRDFFGTGGARQYDALTDLVIGADGRIGLLNDWRDPNRGGTRAGWANGGTDGLEGPGIDFYRRFPRINVHLVSCEHAAKAGQPWTDAQLASTIEIRAAIAQELKCPWERYPIHPAWGTSVEQAHTYFASKSCPAEPYLHTYEPVILAEVKRKLRAWQTGSPTGGPLPPVEPEPVTTYTDLGMTLEHVSTLFGTMRRYREDGTVDDLPFSPTGALSMLWLDRCEKERKWPEAESIMPFDSATFPGKELWAQWEGGWVAILPVGDTRASWVWLDEIARGDG